MAEKTLKVRITGDAANLAQAVDTTERRLGTLGSSLTKLGAATGLLALTNQAAGLVTALAPAAASILALPAAAGVAGSSFAALKLGTMGMGDAFTAVASGDAKALSEALGKLSPQASNFVRAVQSVKNEWGSLQNAVQDQLFLELDASLKRLSAASLPTLRTGLTDVAFALNGVANEAMGAMSTPLFQGAMGAVLRSTSSIINDFAERAVGPLTTGLMNLAAAGTPVVERFMEWATSGIAAAGAFLSTEEGAASMTYAMQRAGDVLAQVFRIGVDVGDTLKNIFSQSNSVGLLDTIEQLSEKMNAWSSSVEGKTQIRDFFEALGRISEHVAEVLPAVADAFDLVFTAIDALPAPVKELLVQFAAWAIVIGPAIKVLATLSVGVKGATTVIDGLVGASNKLPAVITKIGTAFAFMTGPIGIAVGLVAAAAGGFIWAYKNIEPFRNGINALGETWKRLWEHLKVGDVGGAAKVVADWISTVLGWLRDEGLPKLQQNLAIWGQTFLGWLRPRIPALLEELGELATSIWNWLTENGPIIWEKLLELGQLFVNWVKPKIPMLLEKLGELLLAIGEWLLFTALPAIIQQLAEWGLAFLEWVAPRIPELIAELGKLLVRLTIWIIGEALPAIIQQLTEWGWAFVKWVAPKIPPLIAELFLLLARLSAWIVTEALPTIISKLLEWGWAFVRWVAPKIPDMIAELFLLLARLTYFIQREALPQIAAKLVSWGVAFLDWAAVAASGLGGKLATLLGIVIGFAASVPGSIARTIGDLSNLLFDSGKKVVQGLINGMNDRLPSLIITAATIAGRIAGFFPRSPAKTGPLSGRGSPFYSGQKFVEMLSDGMGSRQSVVEERSSRLADLMALSPGVRAVGVTQGSVGAAALQRAGSGSPVSSGPTYNITINELKLASNDPKDFVRQLEALTDTSLPLPSPV